MVAIVSAYRRALVYQRLLRLQYPLTLNGLCSRFWQLGKGKFLDEILKNIIGGNLRTIAHPVELLGGEFQIIEAAEIASLLIRYATDGTACLVPKKLVVYGTGGEIQALLDAGQVPYTNPQFIEAEVAQLWPEQRGAHGDGWRSAQIIEQHEWPTPHCPFRRPWQAALDWKPTPSPEMELAEGLRWLRSRPRELSETGVEKMIEEAGEISEDKALELVKAKDPRWTREHGPGGRGTPGVWTIYRRVTGNRRPGYREIILNRGT